MNNILEMNDIDNKVLEYEQIKIKLHDLYTQKHINEHMIEVTNNDIEKLKKELKSFSLIKKLFKKDDYLIKKNELQYNFDYQNNEMTKLVQNNLDIENIEKIKNEIEKAAEESIKNKFEEIKRKIKNKIVYENGIPIIDDSIIDGLNYCIDCEFDANTFSLNDIALVHATEFFPTDGIIKSSKEAQVVHNKEIEINGKKKNVSSYSHRDSVHFALNGKVSSHTYGNWDKCQFIIIEPIKYHMDVINAISPEDTWTNGSVKLSSEAVILVDEKEYTKLDKKSIEEYKIIKSKGDNKICVDKMLLLLGYKPQNIGMNNWLGENYNNICVNAKILREFVSANYPEKGAKKHFYTTEMEVSNILIIRDEVLSFLRGKTINTNNGLKIDANEMITLFQYFSQKNQFLLYDDFSIYHNEIKLFGKFLKDYGVRYSNGEVYLLDDKSIIKSYEKELEEEHINQIYDFYKEAQSKKEK
jgi:hypothetical protein